MWKRRRASAAFLNEKGKQSPVVSGRQDKQPSDVSATVAKIFTSLEDSAPTVPIQRPPPRDHDKKTPPPEFSATLASIFSSIQDTDPVVAAQGLRLTSTEQDEEEDEVVAPLRLEPPKATVSAVAMRRPTGFRFVGARAVQQPKACASIAVRQIAEVPERKVEKKFVGDLRKTDVRSYGTLDQLLSPGFEHPDAFRPPEDSSPQTAVRPATSPSITFGSASSLLALPSGFSAGRSSVASSNGSDSSDDSIGPQPSMTEQLSEVWGIHSVSSVRLSREDDPSGQAGDQDDAMGAGVSLTSGKTRVMVEPTMMSWHKASGRPQSPMRPGVYVGHEEGEQIELGRHAHKPPANLPPSARKTSTGLFKAVSPPIRPATSAVIVAAREPRGTGRRIRHIERAEESQTVWEGIVQKIEEEGQTDDSKVYEAWRKRVVDCSRTLQLEVARFKLDE